MKKITLESAMVDFSKKFAKSKEMTEQCRKIMPGGFSRRTYNYGPHAIFVEYGDGQYIYTVEGHRLLDLNNNFTVDVLGHNHPAVTKAVVEAAPKGFSFGNPTLHESQLAQILMDRIESVEKVKFSCSATESAMLAVRMARGYTGKNKVAKFEGGFHGAYDSLAISAHPSPDKFPGPDCHPLPVPDSAGIPSFVTANTLILTQNNFPACEKILRENAADVACVIMELQGGAGGVIELEADFIKNIRALTKELGIVFIADETMSLRADMGGLQGVYKVKPDLTVMGKMIGGGFPVGAVGGSTEVFRVVEEDQVMISGTHHGHPLSMVAGIATLKAMDQAAFDKMNRQSLRIKTEVNEWAKKQGYPYVVYGKGFSILGYAFMNKVGAEPKTHRDFWALMDGEKTQAFSLEVATRGFFPVHRGQFSLTLPTTDDDITSYIETTKEIVTGIMA